MSEELSNPSNDKHEKSESKLTGVESSTKEKKIKPPKPEDKPFNEFINDYLIPGIKDELVSRNVTIDNIELKNTERPVVGGLCWVLEGEIDSGRKFWISFSKNEITSEKSITLAERGAKPGLLESFLIDEKKTTLQLLLSRLLQRLNGQKWLGNN